MDSLKIAFIALILTGLLFVTFDAYSNLDFQNSTRVEENATFSQKTENTARQSAVEKIQFIQPRLERRIQVPLVALTGSKEGKVVNVEVTRVKGTGRILVDISNSKIAEGTQESLVNAINAASDFNPDTRRARALSDFIISFNTGEKEISGGSAGVAIATAVIALLSDKGIKKDALVTGGLYVNGTVKPVNGVLEKAKAAKAKGFNLILVPKGSAKLPVTFINESQNCKESTLGVECSVNRELQTLFVNISQESEMQVLEISSLKEAFEFIVT